MPSQALGSLEDPIPREAQERGQTAEELVENVSNPEVPPACLGSDTGMISAQTVLFVCSPQPQDPRGPLWAHHGGTWGLWGVCLGSLGSLG